VLTLIWREAAVGDLEEIVGYIAAHDRPAAEQLQAAIEACAERLPQFPFLYRTGGVGGTREAVVHPNYILVYRVTIEAIAVLAVVHARREYP
jgi:plasmid stabilization system protein ParE